MKILLSLLFITFFSSVSLSQSLFKGNDSLQVVFLIENYEIELIPINFTQIDLSSCVRNVDRKFVKKMAKKIIINEKGLIHYILNPIEIIYYYKGYWIFLSNVDSKKIRKASEFFLIINSCNLKVERIFFS